MRSNHLDQVIQSQKRGEPRGITSICSAHPWVLKSALLEARKTDSAVLIEATCNQVNQFGGYTGMTPMKFVSYLQDIAEENDFPFENIILGGDHLGPSVWQNEPSEPAMQKSEMLIRDYVKSGFIKIHLDCSMRLGDDPEGALDVEVSAKRAARLAKIAEEFGNENLRYVIGTEVPIPGGAKEREEKVSVTKVQDVQQTIEVTREAFCREGLQSAWERVIAVVVQPGVEFGDDFVLEYQAQAARDLSLFIEHQPMVYEAHSTDYQTREALKNLVRDHFAILKVGPALTFAFREAVFALAMMEDELFPRELRSDLVDVIDNVMLHHPEHWQKYYHGSPEQQALARKFSLSDRIRYYWQDLQIQSSLQRLISNLKDRTLPLSLISQYFPQQYEKIRHHVIKNTFDALLIDKIMSVLENYSN